MNMTANLPPASEMRPGIYRVTDGPGHQIHMYHKHRPWNPAQTHFLYLDYPDLGEPADLCLLDLASGERRVIGTAEHWSHHHAARQMWLPDGQHVLWKKDVDGDDSVYAVAGLDGSYETFTTPLSISGTHRPELWVGWRNDQGDRDRRDEWGLMGLDPATREVSLLCSVAEALAAHPEGDRLAELDVIAMQATVHPILPLIKWNLSNGLRDGVEKHTANCFVYHLDTGATTYLGPFAHHPMWHPTEPWVVCFADDDDGRRRLAFLKLEADGTGTTAYLPHFSTTGHPSVSPDGRLVLVDDYDREDATIAVLTLDVETGASRDIAHYPRTAFGDRDADSVGNRKVFARQNYGPTPIYRTQAHPAWDYTGRYVAFNGDPTGQARVYLADLAELDLLPQD